MPARPIARNSSSFSSRLRTLNPTNTCAEQAAERLEASRPLGDRGRENRLAGLAEVGSLGDEAEPVEVHVRAAEHGDEVPAGDLPVLGVALGAGDAQRG